MGFFNLIKEHHAVGTAADLLRQLSRLIIAHITGRRANQLGDGVLFHIFGHVKPDQAVNAVEHFGCQLLD